MSINSIKQKISGITDGGLNTALEMREVLTDITDTFSGATGNTVTNTSELTNDGDGINPFITSADTTTFITSADTASNTSELTNDGSDGINPFITSADTPTNTSELTNDGSDGINPFITLADISTGNRIIDANYYHIQDYEYYAQANQYIINNVWYNTFINDTITLSGGSTFDRIDVVTITSGQTFSIIQGVPDATNPSKPDINDELEVELFFVLVKAGSSSPDNIFNEIIYDENLQIVGGEWDTSVSTAQVIPNYSGESQNGVTSIAFSAVTLGDYINFDNDSLITGDELSNIIFRVNLKNVAPHRLAIRLFNTSTTGQDGLTLNIDNGQFGFDNTLLDTWQTLIIPKTLLGVAGKNFNRIRLYTKRAGVIFLIDNVLIQQGTIFIAIGSNITNTSELSNDGSDGINPFITLEDIPEAVSSYWTSGATGTTGSIRTISGNTTASANYTMAWGQGTEATADYSTSFGNASTASGNYSTAWGSSTNATATHTTSFGFNNTASGSHSTAWGWGTVASSFTTTAWGVNTYATGSRSTAWGDNTLAQGSSTTAWGNNTTALTNNSTAFGVNTLAQGTASTAWGEDTTTYGRYATTWGLGSIASSYGETSIGLYGISGTTPSTVSWVGTDMIFNIGNGTGDGTRSNALTILKKGDVLAPSLTPDIIDSADTKVLITKEYADLNYSGSGGISGSTTDDYTTGSTLTGTLLEFTRLSGGTYNVELSGLTTGGAITFSPTGNTSGLIISGRIEANYGPVGVNAIDLSYSPGPSSTLGATGQGSTASGYRTTAGGTFSKAWGVNSTATGAYSTAFGVNPIASGNLSTAWGGGTTASGDYSTAWGKITTASGAWGTAWGESTIASSTRSTAWGKDTIASGDTSTAWGDGTIAGGDYSTAFGRSTTASGANATAWGQGTEATGTTSTAWGQGTEAFGIMSTAFGVISTASGNFSTAWGSNTSSLNVLSTAWGYGTTASGNYSTAWGSQTNATGAASTAFGLQTTASGNFSTASGYYTTASGPYSTASGAQTTASGEYSSASGYGNQSTGNVTNSWGNENAASGEVSTAWGNSNTSSSYNSTAWGYGTTASGAETTAWGSQTNATGAASTAWGTNSTASGNQSTVWGEATIASGDTSTAWGDGTIAGGDYSTAFGYLNIAGGNYSTAWGTGTQANGSYSTASGFKTIAGGNYSTASGLYITAPSMGETSIGMYGTSGATSGTTDSWLGADRIFNVGNGESKITSSDAFTVLKNGSIYAPSLSISGITGNTQLITKEFADDSYGGNVYTVGSLPSGFSGQRAFVSDANAITFHSIVASGGANFVPVFYDGTNWRIG